MDILPFMIKSQCNIIDWHLVINSVVWSEPLDVLYEVQLHLSNQDTELIEKF